MQKTFLCVYSREN